MWCRRVRTDDEGRIYRSKILFALEKDLLEELEWLNGVSLKYLKNYQIWYILHLLSIHIPLPLYLPTIY